MMNWNRVDIKIGASMMSLFLVVLIPLGIVTDRIFTSFYYQKAHLEVMELSAHFVKMTEAQHGLTSDAVSTMAEFSKVGIHIFDRNGNATDSSNRHSRNMNTLLTTEEWNRLKAGQVIDKEFESPDQEPCIVSGRAFMSNGQFMGGVIITSSLDSVRSFVAQVRQMIAISGVIGVLIALGFSLVLSRRMSKPLRHMVQATRQIAVGQLGTRVPVTSQDEIGSLAHAINDLARDLQRLRESRNEFFANISHELKTPITYLEGYAKVISEEMYESEEEKNAYLQIISAEAVRLNRLINDLFDLSKMEEGRMELIPEAVDLIPLVASAVAKVERAAAQKGLELQFYAELREAIVWGDGMRLEQIWLNLLDNAIRYTQAGSIQVSIVPLKEQFAVRVQDTGIGIPEAELPFLFERLYRVEKSRSRDYGGTGLGLAIVSKLVELHHGRIDVRSEPGQGTVFSVMLAQYEPTKKHQ
ncbi:sensor histidine kinase [Paenibacillus apiarius]|uniref:histidine kinase n=1 Tax=Paenibacillus apiarius TaxID=46240 RepID=A0ABT4DP09_9BACL|nr:HAMP domain-containing sensor histidine kinase [Paenibacillus apiarius]MCY9516036.1 HAMP domain-containing histidine kinase [Paenibacillus apiarius]MCY9518505.1 HAMP domain-containing histidine kinase [Paenibacillus apiarius]MCY9551094.1 HAMP domain-containing histidine kinase [Paenibacillus apiarius]MCY9558248.1 HAMP domain-containing histidine kinase [Paenibacillus apiarius]MCY9684648.1 HAMP domain-containing histidine kinase [Paenibacillus apiarius]